MDKKGFHTMDALEQRKIASLGGKAAHAMGKAHHWNSESARIAGKKGAMQRKKNLEKKREQEASSNGTAENTGG